MSNPVPVPPDAVPEPDRRLARPIERGQVAGVAAGLGDHLGVNPLALRAALVVLAAWQLVGVAAYFVLWLTLPPVRVQTAAPGVDAATRGGLRTAETRAPRARGDLGQLLAFALVGGGLLWLVQALGVGAPLPWLAAGLLLSLALTLVWWHADHAHWVQATGAGPGRFLRSLVAQGSVLAAHVLALVALGGAIGLVLLQFSGLGVLPTIVTSLALLVAGLLLLAAPWLLRARRALALAREEKMLSDARADMAAHLHDSVLQTLALIQRRADDPQAVARLARRQERELRAWLYGADEGADHLVAALREAAAEVEDDFPVRVEVVAVGEDAPLTASLGELVKAAREAMVNAAKHAGVSVVDVYAEVEPSRVEVFVRDRGRGFDLESVAEDRLGVRRSILERMERHHGVARIRSDSERGTEVTLEMER